MSRWIIFYLFSGLAITSIGCGGNEDALPPSATLIVEAREAIDAGDTTKAMEALNASITAEPTAWAYVLRARLNSEAGNDDAALADCDAGLAIDESNEELAWIKKELRKPKASRFQSDSAPATKNK